MKTLKQIIILFACLASCMGCRWGEPKDPYIKFKFYLYCSEDLLDFVTPIATFKDENNIVQEKTLTKSMFILATNNDGLVDTSSTIIYKWHQEIVIKDTVGQRDMRIDYQIREDAPEIDDNKIYVMHHRLDGDYDTQNVTKLSSINTGDDIYTKRVKGIDLPYYLDQIQNDPDYKKIATPSN